MMIGHKKERFTEKLLRADAAARYRDVHLVFGGTGAVGGTAAFHMLSMYEDLMMAQPPKGPESPVVVVTGASDMEAATFRKRLDLYTESRHGKKYRATDTGDGFLTHSGVLIRTRVFTIPSLPGLDEISRAKTDGRAALAADFLRALGTDAAAPRKEISNALRSRLLALRPFSDALEQYLRTYAPNAARERPFRSVILGIPIPSHMAYHFNGLDAIQPHTCLTSEDIAELKSAFKLAIKEDLNRIDMHFAETVLVSHTTAVGGMYDEYRNDAGELADGPLRLGFAHSAQDAKLKVKRTNAIELTSLYKDAGIKTLIAAAAIGIDEVRCDEPVRFHGEIPEKLKAAGEELFPGSATAEHVTVVVPRDMPFALAGSHMESQPAAFELSGSDDRLRPSYALRSGENGWLSVANADALYRVMRVTSAGELGLVLATVALFGDDPLSPWFNEDDQCYYAETDNSRHVFEFLAQPELQHAQLSGLEPMALQDLGSAKHQGELHTLGLMILLHRLRTLDLTAALPADVEREGVDVKKLFTKCSHALTFDDIEQWDVESLERDLKLMVTAERSADLRVLVDPSRRVDSSRQPLLDAILDRVQRAVHAISSLGSPIVYDWGGQTRIRTGYFVAPWEEVLRLSGGVARRLQAKHVESGNSCSPDDYMEFQIAVNGFIDLRPHAVLCAERSDENDLRGKVSRLDEAGLRAGIGKLPRYSFFATSGLVAVLFRLRAFHKILNEARVALGTLDEFRWQFPRDSAGRIVLVPGTVEAMRMVAEGLEKTTGTERLDGLWGYERRAVPDRRSTLLTP